MLIYLGVKGNISVTRSQTDQQKQNKKNCVLVERENN